MMWLDVAYLAIGLPLCLVTPGLCVASRLRGGACEKLAVSVAASMAMIYLVSFGEFSARGSVRFAPFVTLGMALAALAMNHRQVARLAGSRRARRMLAGWGLCLAWVAIGAAVVRYFSGGTWLGDWLEHHQRVRTLLGDRELGALFLGQYSFTARPPLANVVVAHFLAMIGHDFARFQLVSMVVNSLAALPLGVVAAAIAPRGWRDPLWLAVAAALNPMFHENVLYTWTRGLTAFFVILAVWLYLSAWRRGSMPRMVVAFATLAFGCLAHYSAAPFAVALAAHYLLWLVWRRCAAARELALVAATSGAILATWLGWGAWRFGARETFLSNTTVTDSADLSLADNALKMAMNLVDTVVPHVVRLPPGSLASVIETPTPASAWRENLFALYQTNLPLAFGSAGCVLIVALVWNAWRPRALRSAAPATRARYGWSPRAAVCFWPLFSLSTIVLGVAAHGGRDYFGLAHICLLPLVLLGVTWMAAVVPTWRWPWRVALCVGWQVDFLLGVALQLWHQASSLAFRAVGDAHETKVLSGEAISREAARNALVKHTQGLDFIGDHLADYAPLVWMLLLTAGEMMIVCAAARLFLRRGRSHTAAGSGRGRRA